MRSARNRCRCCLPLPLSARLFVSLRCSPLPYRSAFRFNVFLPVLFLLASIVIFPCHAFPFPMPPPFALAFSVHPFPRTFPSKTSSRCILSHSRPLITVCCSTSSSQNHAETVTKSGITVTFALFLYRFLKSGVYLTLERLRAYVYRTLIKRIAAIQAQRQPDTWHQMKLSLIRTALKSLGDEMDDDEVSFRHTLPSLRGPRAAEIVPRGQRLEPECCTSHVSVVLDMLYKTSTTSSLEPTCYAFLMSLSSSDLMLCWKGFYLLAS